MMPKVTKNAKEKFRKRKNTLLEKADPLQSHCQADVYVLLCCQGKYYGYTSMDEASWLPSSESIVRPRSQNSTNDGSYEASQYMAFSVNSRDEDKPEANVDFAGYSFFVFVGQIIRRF